MWTHMVHELERSMLRGQLLMQCRLRNNLGKVDTRRDAFKRSVLASQTRPILTPTTLGQNTCVFRDSKNSPSNAPTFVRLVRVRTRRSSLESWNEDARGLIVLERHPMQGTPKRLNNDKSDTLPSGSGILSPATRHEDWRRMHQTPFRHGHLSSAPVEPRRLAVMWESPAKRKHEFNAVRTTMCSGFRDPMTGV